MPKRVAVDEQTAQAMTRLGELIVECRATNSLRAIAAPSGIPASQLQYIERGIMAPTAEVYPKLLEVLQPSSFQREEMNRLYMVIRKTPPPGVCNTIMSSKGLVEAFSAFEGNALSEDQVQKLLAMLASFAVERKGEETHAETL